MSSFHACNFITHPDTMTHISLHSVNTQYVFLHALLNDKSFIWWSFYSRAVRKPLTTRKSHRSLWNPTWAPLERRRRWMNRNQSSASTSSPPLNPKGRSPDQGRSSTNLVTESTFLSLPPHFLLCNLTLKPPPWPHLFRLEISLLNTGPEHLLTSLNRASPWLLHIECWMRVFLPCGAHL